MKPIVVNVQKVEERVEGVRCFELAAVHGVLPSAKAGAHIDLHLGNDLVRSYSLYEASDEGGPYRIAVALDGASRGGSRYLFDHVQAGQEISISAPKNHFELEEASSHTVLVAGGIGITPLWAMVCRLNALGRPWTLHYAASRRVTAVFLPELQALAQQGLGQLKVSLGDDPSRERIDMAHVFADAPADAHFYCCGPKRMIDAFVQAGEHRAPDRVHVEYFEGVTPVGGERSFVVRLARSEKVIEVPAGKTILEMVELAGIPVAHACKEGVCAACEVRVIHGIPDHKDLVLSKQEKAENQSMMICCSGAVSPELVLDL